MARKLILDVDPGIDDAVAACLALFDPALEVLALTAVAGNVSAEQATRNASTLVEQLDPPRWPRIGTASEPDDGRSCDNRRMHGPDGLGGANLPCADLHHGHRSEKMLVEMVRTAPDEITLLALGPLTNVARFMERDPATAERIGQLVMMGGTLAGPGNVTPTAEYNVYCDPPSARAVYRSPLTKSVVPLDVTSQVQFPFEWLERLPRPESRAGRLLRAILPYRFRACRQELGLEHAYLHDVVGLCFVARPDLFTTEEFSGDVETSGELTLGTTVFDRRRTASRRGFEVAVSVNAAGVRDWVMAGLENAARATD
jgi:purine nucleosidase